MIYGIKQIEKQFPGFEARWTGGMLFDIRNLRKTDSWEDLDEMTPNILDNYGDLLRPVCDKMYFICGKFHDRSLKQEQFNTYFYELCVEFWKEKEEDDIIYADCIEYHHFTKSELHVATSFPLGIKAGKGIMISDLSHISIDDIDKALYFIYGRKGKELKEMPDLIDGIKGEYESFVKKAGTILANALFYLNIRNIKQRTSYITKLCGHYYPKAWGREYKILSLSQTLQERAPEANAPSGYHVRGHLQRGHFKRKPTGVYWWNPHWRGDFSKGIVMKDYKVKAN